MLKRRVGIAVVTVTLLPITLAFTRGGLGVFTVENLPEYLVAGEEVEMLISVRPYGLVLGSLVSTPEVLLTRPGPSVQTLLVANAVSMSVSPSPKPGYYTARVVAPAPGEWTVIVKYAGMPIRLQLEPLPAIAAGSAPPPRPTVSERGRQLYVAKGCVMCHGSSAAPAGSPGAGSTRTNAASELIGRPFASREYVASVLADPDRRLMPNLNLSVDEIRAISTFLHPES